MCKVATTLEMSPASSKFLTDNLLFVILKISNDFLCLCCGHKYHGNTRNKKNQ